MSIDHCCNSAAKGLAGMVCALALFVTACGGGSEDAECGDHVCDGSETASSCAVDCGCGNGVANPGEQCDGTDLGGGTCMDAVNRGGTLRCNADCTFDVDECTLASCGNGVVEEGEACDGSDFGGRTCESIGYGAGNVACTMDCAFDVSACCNDSCPEAGISSCVGDSLRECVTSSTGCLAWQVTDCAATNGVCQTSSATAATCSCIDRCETIGEARCDGAAIQTCGQVGACLDWTTTTNCGATSEICAVAPSGPLCAPDAPAESCADAYPLSPGDNVVAWTAINADYLLADPSCSTYTFDGPDLVLSYTAPEDGFVDFTLNKPGNARQVFVVSSAACGTVTPEVACGQDYTPTSLTSGFAVEAGVTYNVYVRDTTTGAAPLDNPLFVTVDETLCSAIVPTVTTLSPPNNASVPNRSPVFAADLRYPVDPTMGVITVTGDLGTNLSYDLATAPPEITIVDGKTLVIDPGMVFPVNETLTVSWTNLHDSSCGAVVAPPTWTFQITGPPCTPGVSGMVGGTMTRIPTNLTYTSEYFVAADTNPNGYVYVGATADLYRVPKAGGTAENVETLASLTSTQEGYDMLIDGDQIFTLESNTTGATSNLLWRLSSDGGTTWGQENYMQLPQTPGDDMKAITAYKGRYYMSTSESYTSTTDGTQIWSVAANSTALPETAVLETTLPLGEGYCDAIAVDDDYFYLACYDGQRIIRVDRVTHAIDLITDAYYVNSTKNALHAHDFDGDGHADALYFSSYYEEVDYICDPDASGPFYTGVLASFGSTSGNYGLGFDPVNKVLWMYDDDTKEFVKIE